MYSQNTIINSECKRLFCRVKGGDAHWRLYRLPVVTGGAEPQEGGGIARAWIEDPIVYPGIPSDLRNMGGLFSNFNM